MDTLTRHPEQAMTSNTVVNAPNSLTHPALQLPLEILNMIFESSTNISFLWNVVRPLSRHLRDRIEWLIKEKYLPDIYIVVRGWDNAGRKNLVYLREIALDIDNDRALRQTFLFEISWCGFSGNPPSIATVDRIAVGISDYGYQHKAPVFLPLRLDEIDDKDAISVRDWLYASSTQHGPERPWLFAVRWKHLVTLLLLNRPGGR